MTEPIKLPPEFRSGNSIPVERATITRERMIEILAAAIEADRKRRGDPTPPKDAACFDDWVTASDVDGVVYDGPSFERGYQCGKIAELDRLTGHAPEWPDFARMEACLHRLKERLVFENSRRNDLEQKLRKKRNG